MTPAELFIHLEHFLLERRPPRPGFFVNPNLPDPANFPNPTIHLHREQLERFRSDFAELTAFVCAVCRVEPEHLARFDLLMAVRQQMHVEQVLAAAKTLVEDTPLGIRTRGAGARALDQAERHLRALGRFGPEPL